MEAIQQRRSVRSFTAQTLDRGTLQSLLAAAVRAPTAMDQEPWAFVVIQDASVLDRLSTTTKDMLRVEAKKSDSPSSAHLLHMADNPHFHVFHHASTLVVICGKFQGPFVEADCWLAAENFMLAACAEGLGTCVIGFAVEALNTPEWKTELKIPDGMTAIAPIIVGNPASEGPPTPRKPPEILFWQ
jgi:nitroreductase